MRSFHRMCFILFLYGHTRIFVANTEEVEYAFTPPSVNQVQGKTIFTIINMEVTWNHAVEICKNDFPEGSLARPDNLAAMTEILEGLTAGDEIWFGLHWSSSTELSWSDISCSAFDDTYFGRFGVNEDSYSASQRCYYIDANEGSWKRDACNAQHKFVCEHKDGFCSGNNNGKSNFNNLKATFFAFETNPNPTKCAKKCLTIDGCFLSWVGNRLCLFGIVDKDGHTQVLQLCYEVTTQASANTYTSSTSSDPSLCNPLNGIVLTGSGVDLIAVPGDPSYYICNGIGTDTETETYTTTLALPVQTSTVIVQSCTNTATELSVQLTTVTFTATPVLAALTTVLHTDCVSPSSLSPSQCPDPQTVTKVTTDRVTATATINDCSMTSSCMITTTTIYGPPFALAPSTQIVWGGQVTTTVTDSNCIAGISTLTTTATTTEIRTQSHTPLVLTTTSVKEVIVPTTVFSVNDCTNSIGVGVTDVLTKTLTTTEISTCDITPGPIVPTTVVSSVYVTTTVSFTQVVTQTAGADILQSCQPQASMDNSSNNTSTSTISPQQLKDLNSAIVEDLIVPTAELSKTRRTKESATDPRISAQMSGWAAVAFISCLLTCILILDAPLLLGHLKARVQLLQTAS